MCWGYNQLGQVGGPLGKDPAAAAEDVALGQAIEELPNTLEAAEPAFANLNASFPALRAFAREALPGTRSPQQRKYSSRPPIRASRTSCSLAGGNW